MENPMKDAILDIFKDATKQSIEERTSLNILHQEMQELSSLLGTLLNEICSNCCRVHLTHVRQLCVSYLSTETYITALIEDGKHIVYVYEMKHRSTGSALTQKHTILGDAIRALAKDFANLLSVEQLELFQKQLEKGVVA